MNDILDGDNNISSNEGLSNNEDNSNIIDTPIEENPPNDVENIPKDKSKVSFKDKAIDFIKSVQGKVQKFEITQLMDIFVRVFASYFIVTLYNLTKIEDDFNTLDYPRNLELKNFIIYICAIFIILTLIRCILKNLKIGVNSDGYFLAVAILLYGLTTIFKNNNFYYAVGVSIVVSLCMIFLVGNGYFKEFKTLSNLQTKIIIAIFGIFVATFLATFCIYRYLVYSTSCFDFGIFCQMYYYLVHSFTPDTTCERNELLSHFAIHVSPIYYLLVPIFAIWQKPETLLVCQAIIEISGVIPLYLICKNFKFSNAVTMAMCVTYVFSPALISCTFFDFHENKFLFPLILWLLWSIDTNHIKLMYVFTFLTLFVKEDAFIYVTCIALYVITSNKKVIDKKTNKEKSLLYHGILIVVLALLYFTTVTTLMEKYGRGVMEYRYSNLMMDTDDGLINVVKTVLLDPALAISEAFEEEKFLFFLQMTVPLILLPFASKKISHVFLLIPFFLVNLMSDYHYQTQLGYQYVCGVMSLLIYTSALNISEMQGGLKKYLTTGCMCTSMIIGVMYGSNRMWYYDNFCTNERIYYTNHMMRIIPDDASVECNTYYVPQLSQREVIYMMEEPQNINYEQTDFVIIRPDDSYYSERVQMLMDEGYEFYNGYQDLVYVFVKSSYISEHPELLDNQRDAPMIMSR